MGRWICHPGERDLSDYPRAPAEWTRRATFALLSRVPLGDVRPETLLSNPRSPLIRWYRRQIENLAGHYLSFAPAMRPEASQRVWAHPIFSEMNIVAQAALARLQDDGTSLARRLHDYALTRRNDFLFEDGSYRFFGYIVADMFFTHVHGMHAERQNASREFWRTPYEKGGWMSGPVVSNNVFDTALSMQALFHAGVSRESPMVHRAMDFLRDALATKDGACGWSYFPNKRWIPNTDDTAAACLALHAWDPRSQAAAKAGRALMRFQEGSGGFSTWDQRCRPNFVFVSNSARGLLALLAAGDRPEEASIHRASRWLLSQQKPDGSWMDGWITRNIYGTLMGIEALSALLKPGAEPLRRALAWIRSRQNADGGWGDSYAGAQAPSTVEHTGMALKALALGSAGDRPHAIVDAGVDWLARRQRADGSWPASHYGSWGGRTGYTNECAPMYWGLLGLAAVRQAQSEELS
jgi:hypothetical protein